MSTLRFHGNTKPEGVFSISADGTLYFDGEMVGTIEATRAYVPREDDQYSFRTIEFVARGVTLKTGPKWNDPTVLSTTIASSRGEDVIVPDMSGRTISDAAVAQVMLQYNHIVRTNAETTTTHSVLSEVADPNNLWEIYGEVEDTANECGYRDLSDSDLVALRAAAKTYCESVAAEIA